MQALLIRDGSFGLTGSGGKAFSNASIGEAGEKAFPTGADGKNEQNISVSSRSR